VKLPFFLVIAFIFAGDEDSLFAGKLQFIAWL